MYRNFYFCKKLKFNGDYGCSVCLCKGTSVPVVPNGHVHVYPYENELELRTSEESIRYSELVAEHNKPVMNVKGPTALSKLMTDFIRGTLPSEIVRTVLVIAVKNHC